jgi:hypothetical protein
MILPSLIGQHRGALIDANSHPIYIPPTHAAPNTSLPIHLRIPDDPVIMSDDDFMLESDQEGYDFEYEDEGEEESGDVDVENKYYNAKQMKLSDPQGAIEEFLGVVALEKEKGDWCAFCYSLERCIRG